MLLLFACLGDSEVGDLAFAQLLVPIIIASDLIAWLGQVATTTCVVFGYGVGLGQLGKHSLCQ